MLRRAFLVLFGTLALAACGSGGSYGPAGTGPTVLGTPAANASAHGGSRVAILLPLSGPRADLGQAMLQAAQLALPAPDSPPLSVKDTRGTPEGAAAAAQQAMAEGVGIILGPLTSAETAAVAPIARNAGVPVLAFTNDPSQAQPGVWTLGITPGQQIRRLLAATQA
ncbi:MAG: penicillin-binding protein activator, partial [Rhodospirillales bacterium]|nr:penicillin-binding protein activator [Rhodospirillales bacterium]